MENKVKKIKLLKKYINLILNNIEIGDYDIEAIDNLVNFSKKIFEMKTPHNSPKNNNLLNNLEFKYHYLQNYTKQIDKYCELSYTY
jgi:hypothetical protein